MLKIRQENENDYEKIYNVVKRSFQTAEYTDGNEQDLVEELRKGDNFIPELSLVAMKENQIVGYILFTKIAIGEHEELALAPLAVLSEYQRQGIGKELTKKGHKIAKQLGYHYSVVLGNKQYYSKFGYVPAKHFGIIAPFEVENENFMAIQLNDINEKITGVVKQKNLKFNNH